MDIFKYACFWGNGIIFFIIMLFLTSVALIYILAMVYSVYRPKKKSNDMDYKNAYDISTGEKI